MERVAHGPESPEPYVNRSRGLEESQRQDEKRMLVPWKHLFLIRESLVALAYAAAALGILLWVFLSTAVTAIFGRRQS